MKTNTKIILLTFFCLLLAVSLKYFPYHCNSKVCLARDAAKTNEEAIHLGDTTLNVSIANTEVLQDKGLSGRASLSKDTGMLFVFATTSKYGFWMKDMNFDLDIVWIDKDQKVIGIEKNASKNSYPKVFYPSSDIKFVLEVPSGYTSENNINIGDYFSPTF